MDQSFRLKLITSIARFSTIEKLSIANIKLDVDAFKMLCAYLKKNYSLKDLNLRQLNIPVREFAIFLPALAENRKLQYLNISGNTIVDANADIYDNFDLDGLNEQYSGQAPKEEGKAKAGAPKKGGKDDAPKKVKKMAKPMKRRTLAKVS